jgi:hypothetical protein
MTTRVAGRLAISCLLLLLVYPRSGQAQDVLEGLAMRLGGCGQFSQGKTNMSVRAVVPNWRGFNGSNIQSLFDVALRFADDRCRSVKFPGSSIGLFEIFVDSPKGSQVLVISRQNMDPIRVSLDRRNDVARDEKLQADREVANANRAAADAARKAAALEDLEKQRKAATSDCGTDIKLSGGPWFSSTYAIAAKDEAKRGFFCVKSIEYVSEAVNPFGGKAARARFIGYSQQDFSSVTEVRDFPY